MQVTAAGRAAGRSSPVGWVPGRYARDARWVEPRLAGEVAFTERFNPVAPLARTHVTAGFDCGSAAPRLLRSG